MNDNGHLFYNAALNNNKLLFFSSFINSKHQIEVQFFQIITKRQIINSGKRRKKNTEQRKMVSKQMREREESLLNILGYPKLNEGNKNTRSKKGLNSLFVKSPREKMNCNQFFKSTMRDQKADLISQGKKQLMNQTVNNDCNFRHADRKMQSIEGKRISELPLISNNANPKSILSNLLKKRNQLNEDEGNNQSMKNNQKEEFIWPEFQKSNIQRLPTRELMNQANYLKRNRKSLMLHQGVSTMWSEIQKESGPIKPRKQYIFKDQKLNISETCKHLELAKMIPPSSSKNIIFNIFKKSEVRVAPHISIMDNTAEIKAHETNGQIDTSLSKDPLPQNKQASIWDLKQQQTQGNKQFSDILQRKIMKKLWTTNSLEEQGNDNFTLDEEQHDTSFERKCLTDQIQANLKWKFKSPRALNQLQISTNDFSGQINEIEQSPHFQRAGIHRQSTYCKMGPRVQNQNTRSSKLIQQNGLQWNRLSKINTYFSIPFEDNQEQPSHTLIDGNRQSVFMGKQKGLVQKMLKDSQQLPSERSLDNTNISVNLSSNSPVLKARSRNDIKLSLNKNSWNQRFQQAMSGRNIPSSLNSPTKKRIVLQDYQEDNYYVMHSCLMKSLNQNEVITQYIEQSGYSIEMFAFYMMKLYTHCIQKLNSIQYDQSREGSITQISHKPTDLQQGSQAPEFPTLKVNEATLFFVHDIFINKMKELKIHYAYISKFNEEFTHSMKLFLPSSFIENLGGPEKIKTIVTHIIEHMCYEYGLIRTFDENLINYATKGSLILLRSEQHLLQPYLDHLRNSPIPISDAEIYQLKITLWKVMTSMGYEIEPIHKVLQRIEKQRVMLYTLNDFSKDQSFRSGFITAISKNKRVVGYFLDPSILTISSFYEVFFGCLLGSRRYLDLIDFLENRLKTGKEIPELMIDDITKTILDLTSTLQQNDRLSLLHKEILIKIDRIKQKAGILSYSFLKLPISIDKLHTLLMEWCDEALVNDILPQNLPGYAIIKSNFLKEYLYLVISEEEQIFSIYDLDYALDYHNIIQFEKCFPIWLKGIHDVLLKHTSFSVTQLDLLLTYLHKNSLATSS